MNNNQSAVWDTASAEWWVAVECPSCDGEGSYLDRDCQQCNGKGWLLRPRSQARDTGHSYGTYRQGSGRMKRGG